MVRDLKIKCCVQVAVADPGSAEGVGLLTNQLFWPISR